MKHRILIPTEDSEGAIVAGHFGRAPFFTVFDLDDSGSIIEKSVYPNTGEHSGGHGHAHDNVLKLEPATIIVYGMGPRGIAGFQRQSIAVLKANSGSVSEVISAYTRNELSELTEGCADAHHR